METIMAARSDVDRVWELMEKIAICMLTTHDGEQIRSRPMAAFVRREDDAIYFLGDARQHKDEEIHDNQNVGLAFADGQKFVSVTGQAAVSRDQAKIKELWGVAAKAWWDSPDDPNIRLLTVTPDDAEFWEGPGKIVGTIKMVAAAATNSRPDYGENRKVAM
jgi:general stress protein 26